MLRAGRVGDLVADLVGAGVVCCADGIAAGVFAAVDATELAALVVGVLAALVPLSVGALESSVQLPMTASSTTMTAPTPVVFGWRRHQDQNRDHRDVPATPFTNSLGIALRDDHRTSVCQLRSC